ncbi:major capsid protein E [Clostridium botulinum]|nr:major capsid protein E [Clostridium botulinum]NFS95384.1 major capsid protein E [Clostridium botulinum]
MPRVEEVFNTNELINYFSERQETPMLGEALFPERKIQDIEFDMILGRGGIPVSASVHAFDTKTQIASRQAIQKGAQELALIKRQIPMREKDIIKVQNPRNDAELAFVLSQLYNDAEDMKKSVKVRTEAMRMELLSSGQIKIEENEVKVTLDYGLPSANKKSATWKASETDKPLDDIKALARAVKKSSGVMPTRALTSDTIVDTICNCTSVRKAIFGVNSDMIPTIDDLNNLLSRLKLPKFITYDELYKIETATGFDTKRYYPENKITFLSSNTPGETIFGLTAEEIEMLGNGQMNEAAMVGNIFIGTYTTVDPVAKYTKAVATALPSCPHADEIGIMTVTLS